MGLVYWKINEIIKENTSLFPTRIPIYHSLGIPAAFMEFSILPTIEFHIQCLPGISACRSSHNLQSTKDLRALISP